MLALGWEGGCSWVDLKEWAAMCWVRRGLRQDIPQSSCSQWQWTPAVQTHKEDASLRASLLTCYVSPAARVLYTGMHSVIFKTFCCLLELDLQDCLGSLSPLANFEVAWGLACPENAQKAFLGTQFWIIAKSTIPISWCFFKLCCNLSFKIIWKSSAGITELLAIYCVDWMCPPLYSFVFIYSHHRWDFVSFHLSNETVIRQETFFLMFFLLFPPSWIRPFGASYTSPCLLLYPQFLSTFLLSLFLLIEPHMLQVQKK